MQAVLYHTTGRGQPPLPAAWRDQRLTVDCVAQIPFRGSGHLSVLLPSVALYLAMVMCYGWPLALLSRPLWFAYAVLFVVATILNITTY